MVRMQDVIPGYEQMNDAMAVSFCDFPGNWISLGDGLYQHIDGGPIIKGELAIERFKQMKKPKKKEINTVNLTELEDKREKIKAGVWRKLFVSTRIIELPTAQDRNDLLLIAHYAEMGWRQFGPLHRQLSDTKRKQLMDALGRLGLSQTDINNIF